ncbi:MAG: serine/threonine-protein phosphatase [Acidisphaera sp.]|nr:serine/threonine-protein phosphatase [Acidisphaera sp.]
MSTPRHRFEFAAVTTRGLQRRRNEDALGAGGVLLVDEVTEPLYGAIDAEDAAVFVLADGVSGHAHGALASREAVAELMADASSLAEPQTCMDAVRRANLRLHETMMRQPETIGMATTVAGLSLHDRVACWFNVGDSRVYRMRPEGLEQISVDDRQARSHGILQSLGGQLAILPIRPHIGCATIKPGEILLLCTDGLTDMLPDMRIAAIIAEERQVTDAVAALLQAALDAGGTDNVSIALVKSAPGML